MCVLMEILFQRLEAPGFILGFWYVHYRDCQCPFYREIADNDKFSWDWEGDIGGIPRLWLLFSGLKFSIPPPFRPFFLGISLPSVLVLLHVSVQAGFCLFCLRLTCHRLSITEAINIPSFQRGLLSFSLVRLVEASGSLVKVSPP